MERWPLVEVRLYYNIASKSMQSNSVNLSMHHNHVEFTDGVSKLKLLIALQKFCFVLHQQSAQWNYHLWLRKWTTN